MPEPQTIHQEKSKPITNEIETSIANLARLISELEAKKIRNFYSEDIFEYFYINFRTPVLLTQNIKGLQEVKFGKLPLLPLIHQYFKNDPRGRSEFGINLATAYLKAVFEKGVVSK